MGRAVDGHLAELLGSLGGHGAVALHDPGRDLLVALPGGVLHDDATLAGIGLGGGHADALVVVDLLDGHLGALGGDVVKARLRGALGHVHDGLLAELVGGPGNAAAVVAVRGGEERGLAEVLGELVGGEVVERAVGDVLARLVGDVVGHGERSAEHLEGVEAEAVGLVLDAQVAKAQASGLAVEARERRHGVLREALVEGAGLLDVVERHDAQVRIVTLGHVVDGPLNLLAHVTETSLVDCIQLFV